MAGRLVQLKTQLLAAVVASVSYFTAGMVRAWASPGVPSIRGNKTHFGQTWELDATEEELSWITSLAPMGAMIGSLLSSFPLHWAGRKATILLAAVLFAADFILQGCSYYMDVTETIMVARVLCGIGVGLSIPAAPIYVSECSESSIRGTLTSAPAVFMALGILVTYAVGIALPWHYLSFFCAAFPILLFITVLPLPRSPVWLLANDKMEEAKIALKWFRPGQDVNKEFDQVKENIERARKTEEADDKKAKKVDWEALVSRRVVLPLLISIALMVFQQWCGVNAVIFKTVDIFAEVEGGPKIADDVSTVIVGVVQFLATFMSIFLVDRAGRKPLLLLSGLVMAVGLFPVAIYFQLMEEAIAWFPLAGIIIFMIGYSVGYAAVPYVIMGELFPSKQRNLLAAISSTVNLACVFLVVKLYDNIKESEIGTAGNFWIYAVMSAVSCPFVYFFVPETKGKTLEDIEAYFRKQETMQD